MEGYQLPENWALATIEDIAEYVQRGKSPKYTDFSDLPVINQKCVRWHGIDKEFVKFVHADQISKWDEVRHLKRGDLLWNSTGTGTIGRACLYRGEFPQAVVDSHVTIVRSNPNLVESGYMHFFVMSPLVQENFESMQSGSTNQVELSRAAVLEKKIPVPPLHEQRRIVEKIESLFSQLDHGEAGLRDVQKLLTRYRQSVLKAAVTGQLTADWRAENVDCMEHCSDLLEHILQVRRDSWQGRGKYKEPVAPDTGDLPELPEGWVWASVDQMVEVFRNGLSKKPAAEKNHYPILRISAVRPMSVSLSDLRYYAPSESEDVSSYWVERGDLLFTRYSGSAHFVGVCGQMRDASNVLHPDKLIKVRVVDAPQLCIDFLELAWNAGFTRTHIASNIKTTSGQQGIAGGDIKSAPFPLPSADEQVVIAERVWEAFEKMERLQSHCQDELTRSAALRQSILKDAFAGKLVTQDPDDEPAAELLARIRAERDVAPKKSTRKKATA